MSQAAKAAERTLVLWVRATGLAVLAMVCLPVIVHGGHDADRLWAWSGVCLAFAGALWTSAAAPARGPRAGLLVIETACVVAMVLLLCDGFEGSLLVLVALQLGRVVDWRAGILIILAQTALLGLAVGVHWNPGAALLLAPPYLGFQLLAFAVARLVTQQEQARQELARANTELAAAKGVAEDNSRLAERLRIARELHDAVGHRLTALRLHLEAATRTAEGPTRDACETARMLAGEALSDVRDVVSALRDGERIDLVTALRMMAAEIPAPRVHVTTPTTLSCHDAARALTVLRCTQEIVTNAARHAAAENLWIDVRQDGGIIEISARDDGRGADTVAAGSGLRGMRERIEELGGQLDVATARGAGFTLHARVPVEVA